MNGRNITKTLVYPCAERKTEVVLLCFPVTWLTCLNRVDKLRLCFNLPFNFHVLSLASD